MRSNLLHIAETARSASARLIIAVKGSPRSAQLAAGSSTVAAIAVPTARTKYAPSVERDPGAQPLTSDQTAVSWAWS